MRKQSDADVLRMVRVRIAQKQSVYICIALEYFVHTSRKQKKRLLKWISSMLDVGEGSIENYLRRNGITLPRSYLALERHLRLYRLRWLDHLIAICEEEDRK